MTSEKKLDLHVFVDREDWEFCLNHGRKKNVSGAEILRQAIKFYRKNI